MRGKDREACSWAERPGRCGPRVGKRESSASVVQLPRPTMPVVLPGEVVHTQHKTLKLGPGLQQFTNHEGRISNLVTRAGTLEQNAKGNQFWVEGNSRRVSCPSFRVFFFSFGRSYMLWTKVCAGAARACHRYRERSTG